MCKHAGPVEVALTVRHETDAVTVVVDNDGPPAGPVAATSAHGIVGMRERVTALGGTCAPGRARTADTGSPPSSR